MREALSKERKKDGGGGEDQWLLKPSNSWSLAAAPDAEEEPAEETDAAGADAAAFSAFGVFDGHGGRQVATFASNQLLKAVMAEVDAAEALQQVRCGCYCRRPHTLTHRMTRGDGLHSCLYMPPIRQ